MSNGGRRLAGVVVAVLLLAAIFTLGRMSVGGDDPAAGGGSPGAGAPGGSPEPASGEQGTGEDPGAVRAGLEGSARSVVAEATVTGLTTLRLQGQVAIDAVGVAVDAGGRSWGQGRLLVNGGDVTLTGPLAVSSGRLLVRPGEVVLDRDGELGTAATVLADGAVTIHAPDLRFEGEGGGGAPQAVPSPATVSAPPGEVRLDIEGAGLRWLDAPAELRLTGPSHGRAGLSWAGSGVIRPDGLAEVSAQFLGLKAGRLAVTLSRGGGAVAVRGDAHVRQVYADGHPQLRTTGRAVLKSVDGPVPSGGRGWFTWAPENRGVYDMTITRIGPANPAGGWVNLALDRLPAMCGGEPCPRAGGDTTGLGKRGGGLFGGSARPIDAVILPGTGDESRISFDVPSGTPAGRHLIVLAVEGNFDAVTVEIPIDVT